MATGPRQTERGIKALETLLDIIQNTLRTHPERGFRFIRSGTTVVEKLSYAELDKTAQNIAASLCAMGMEPGSRALLAFQPGLDFIKAFWGCLYAGIIPVPAPPPQNNRLERTLSRLQRIAHDCEPSVVLSDSRLLSPDLGPVLTLEKMNTEPEKWQAPNLNSLSTAFLQYTSGSTRHPRGVVVTHGNIVANLKMLSSFHGEQENMVMVHWLPLFHDMGLIRGMLSPLQLGANCYLMEPMEFIQRPVHWLTALSHFQATITGAPNFGYEMASRKVSPEYKKSLDLTSLKIAFCSAEPIRSTTVEHFLDKFRLCGFAPQAFKPSYGLAEATVAVSGELGPKYGSCELSAEGLRQGRVSQAINSEDSRILISCGQLLGELELEIVDETSQPCPEQTVGEIWLRGPSIAKRYWNSSSDENPFESYLSNGEGPYLRTGDLGFTDVDGSLYITGRKKDLIIIRGQNYYPQDIEATLEDEIPKLRRGCTAVFQTGERIGVSCESRTDDLESLAQSVRAIVGEEFGLAVVLVMVLPLGTSFKTSSGKIQRALTQKRYLEGTLSPLYQWNRPQT